jgi:hypothetical protein
MATAHGEKPHGLKGESMAEVHCPHCEGTDWVPVVRIFLDVGVGRPPRPLALDGEEDMNPAEMCFRCANGCVGITASGQFVPLLGRPTKATER